MGPTFARIAKQRLVRRGLEITSGVFSLIGFVIQKTRAKRGDAVGNTTT